MTRLERRTQPTDPVRERPELPAAERHDVATLARAASVEMTWRDVDQLGACRSLLTPEAAIFESHLPGQTWQQTLDTCVAIRGHGPPGRAVLWACLAAAFGTSGLVAFYRGMAAGAISVVAPSRRETPKRRSLES